MSNRVLIGCPTHESQKYCLPRFLEALGRLHHVRKDVVFVDNSPNEVCVEDLKKQGFTVFHTKEEKGLPAIVENRKKIVQHLLKDKSYTHILFLDTDIFFPEDTLKKLLSQNVPIATGVYLGGQEIKGKIRLAPVLYDFAQKLDYIKPMPVNKIMGDAVFEVAACGFGCCLIEREVFEQVELRYNKELGGGEDILFCKDAREKGYRTYVDTSIKCIHMRPEKDLVFPAAVIGFSVSYD